MKNSNILLKIFYLCVLTLISSGCFSARDEYAFMATQYLRNGNQLPYVQAVKAIDASNDYSHCPPCLTRYELPQEQGSILITTPGARN